MLTTFNRSSPARDCCARLPSDKFFVMSPLCWNLTHNISRVSLSVIIITANISQYSERKTFASSSIVTVLLCDTHSCVHIATKSIRTLFQCICHKITSLIKSFNGAGVSVDKKAINALIKAKTSFRPTAASGLQFPSDCHEIIAFRSQLPKNKSIIQSLR